jgi:hypothetical protein
VSFAVRQLTEARRFYDSSPSYRCLAQFGDDTWARSEFGGHLDAAFGIVWHAELRAQLRLEAREDFWKAHADHWWSRRAGGCGASSTTPRTTSRPMKRLSILHGSPS